MLKIRSKWNRLFSLSFNPVFGYYEKNPASYAKLTSFRIFVYPTTFHPNYAFLLKKKPGPLINGILNWAAYLYLSSHLLLPLGTNLPLQTLCVSHFSICSLCDVKYAIEIQVNTVFLKKSTDNPSLIFTDFEVTSSFCPIINVMLTCRKKLVHKSTVVLYAGKKIKYLSE